MFCDLSKRFNQQRHTQDGVEELVAGEEVEKVGLCGLPMGRPSKGGERGNNQATYLTEPTRFGKLKILHPGNLT